MLEGKHVIVYYIILYIILHIIIYYTLCLYKKTCQLFFCSVSVRYEHISIKIGRHARNKHLTKLCIKFSLYLTYMLALP